MKGTRGQERLKEENREQVRSWRTWEEGLEGQFRYLSRVLAKGWVISLAMAPQYSSQFEIPPSTPAVQQGTPKVSSRYTSVCGEDKSNPILSALGEPPFFLFLIVNLFVNFLAVTLSCFA